ncbi:hypothetical protein EVA_09008 [gut metagenome]|uniref:Uncharacterized protein n=1 Tax=gut metagenome TaxID=749906 RepID=J9G6L2_9ZZZZ
MGLHRNIKACGHLIQHQKFRLYRNSPCNGDALTLTTTEGTGLFVQIFFTEAHCPDKPHRLTSQFLFGKSQKVFHGLSNAFKGRTSWVEG